MDLALIIIEIVGVLAVIFSLFYVARQIRDNTRISEASTRQSIQESLLNVSMTFFTDTDFRKIFNKHLNNEELSSEQQIYLETFGYSCFRNFENIHSQFRMKMLSNEDWSTFRKNLKAMCQTPVLRNFWKRESENFNESFVMEVNQIFKELIEEPTLMPEALFQPKNQPEES